MVQAISSGTQINQSDIDPEMLRALEVAAKADREEALHEMRRNGTTGAAAVPDLEQGRPNQEPE